MPLRGILPALKLVEVGRREPIRRGCAPRGPSSGEMCGPSTWNASIACPSGSDSRAAARLRRAASIASGAPVITVGIEARYAGRESRVNGPLDFVMRRDRRVEIDPREAVDLKIDETGRDEDVSEPSRIQYRIDILNRRFEFNFDRLAGYRAAPATFHRESDLYTAYPQ